MTSDMPFVFVGCNARQSSSRPGQWGVLQLDTKLHRVTVPPQPLPGWSAGDQRGHSHVRCISYLYGLALITRLVQPELAIHHGEVTLEGVSSVTHKFGRSLDGHQQI